MWQDMSLLIPASYQSYTRKTGIKVNFMDRVLLDKLIVPQLLKIFGLVHKIPTLHYFESVDSRSSLLHPVPLCSISMSSTNTSSKFIAPNLPAEILYAFPISVVRATLRVHTTTPIRSPRLCNRHMPEFWLRNEFIEGVERPECETDNSLASKQRK